MELKRFLFLLIICLQIVCCTRVCAQQNTSLQQTDTIMEDDEFAEIKRRITLWERCRDSAQHYFELGNYDKALTYQLGQAQLEKIDSTTTRLEAADLITNLGIIYQKMGKYAEAEKLLLRALRIREMRAGNKYPTYACATYNLANLYLAKKDTLSAVYYFLKTWDVHNAIFDGEFPKYVNDLSEPYFSPKYYETVEHQRLLHCLNEAIQSRTSPAQQNQADYAAYLYYYGIYQRELENEYALAEQYLKDALRIQANTIGEHHPEYARTLMALGQNYLDLGQYEKSEANLLNALSIYESLPQAYSEEYVNTLQQLVFLYYQRDNAKAELYEQKILQLLQSTIGDKNLIYANYESQAGYISLEKSEFAEAEKHFLNACTLRDSISRLIKIPEHVSLRHDLGSFYLRRNEFEKAEEFLLPIQEDIEMLYGKQHRFYAIATSSIGTLCFATGNYKKAEKYTKEALSIYDSLGLSGSKDYAYELNGLGVIYTNQKDYQQALHYSLAADTIYQRNEELTSVSYAGLLNNIGYVYHNLKDYTNAEKYYLRSWQVYQSIHANKDERCSYPLGNLGVIYRDLGKYENAEPLLLLALQIREETLDETHSLRAASLLDIGKLYQLQHKYKKANTYYQELLNLNRKRFVSSTSFMTEKQREAYWQTMQESHEINLPNLCYSSYPENRESAILAYENELFKKGLLLSSTNAIRYSIMESGDSTLMETLKEIEDLRKNVDELRQHAPHMEIVIEGRENRADRWEKELTKKTAVFRENLRQWNITWDSVKAALKPDQVAIEYMTAPLSEDSTMYCALLLRDTCSAPILIPLFEEKEVAGLLNTSTADSADIRRTYAYADNGKKLSTIIWQHITPYLNTNDEVFFSPTGVLHQIAIENLPLDSSRIMAEAYQLVRLSSTRELVLNKPSTPHEKAALYGNIYYTADEATMLAYHQPYEHIALSEDVLLASNTRSVQRGSAKNLPGTKKEIDSIAPILQKKHVAVQIYTAYEANEESLKSLSGTRQNIIHLATHGFYWPDSTAQKEKYFTQRAADHDSYLTSIDPLERCGLLFAGANNAYTGHRDRVPEKVQDGILTAKEISLLDFRKADVVVLSACETGLGDVSGDGVFGLQRAFKMAGAQTLLMALWQVSDDATQRLMTAFYRHMSDGLSKREAFRRAQQEVRNYTPQKEVKDAERGVMQDNYKKRLHPAANGGNQPSTPVVEQPTTVVHPYASPYYWAGFVLLD